MRTKNIEKIYNRDWGISRRQNLQDLGFDFIYVEKDEKLTITKFSFGDNG